MVDSPGATPLRKLIIPPQKPSAAPCLRVEVHEHLPPDAGMLTGLILFRQPQVRWVHVWRGPVRHSEDAFLAWPAPTKERSCRPLFCDGPWVLGLLRYKHPIYRWAFRWHLFSAPWPLITPFKGQTKGWMHEAITVNLHDWLTGIKIIIDNISTQRRIERHRIKILCLIKNKLLFN